MREQPNNPGITQMYSARNFAAGPSTYSSQEFLQKICQATGLDALPQPARVLDSMSGPGLLGSGLQKIAPQHQYFYLDLVRSQLAKIPDADGKIAGDARRLPFRKEAFQIGVVRYAAKDIIEEQQLGLFQEMYRITARGGRWVLADMYAPVIGNKMQDGQIYEWLNYQHAIKQELGGRNRAIEGTCHIPTEQGWLDLLKEAGFQTEAVNHHISFVTTNDWLKSNQVTEQQLEKLNQIILTAPDAAKRAFNIRTEKDLVKVDYPVTIIRATKPI